PLGHADSANPGHCYPANSGTFGSHRNQLRTLLVASGSSTVLMSAAPLPISTTAGGRSLTMRLPFSTDHRRGWFPPSLERLVLTDHHKWLVPSSRNRYTRLPLPRLSLRGWAPTAEDWYQPPRMACATSPLGSRSTGSQLDVTAAF